jgi:hypothetical protein
LYYSKFFFAAETHKLIIFKQVIMRCCGAGGPQPDKEEVRANKNIAKQLKKDQEDFENEMKLLLLGNYYGSKMIL